MIDDTTLELLSRSLDEDLSVDEERVVERLLKQDPEARIELEALRKFRDALSESAAQMEPPEELDALLEPLRRAAPGPRRVGPVLQWMAVAAVVVIGLTVGLEVAKQRPIHEVLEEERVRVTASDGSSAAREGYFQLQPLPTASPDEEELVGAVEHLMAVPAVEPVVDEPKPLEIMGPLSAASPAEEIKEEVEDADADADADDARRNRMHSPDRKMMDEARTADPPRPQVMRQEASAKKMARAGSSPAGEESPVVETALVFAAEDGGMTIPCTPPAGTPQGIWWLTVIVEDAVIIDCAVEGNADRDRALVCDAVQGLRVGGLQNGEYRTRFVNPGPESGLR